MRALQQRHRSADIDARKSAEAALASVREQHHLILDNVLVGVAFLRERCATQCNRAFEQLLGWEPGELSGRSSREWFSSQADWQAAGQRCDEPFRQGGAFEGEITLRHRDGHAIECEVRAKAIDPAQPELGSIWITMAISARKVAERALQAEAIIRMAASLGMRTVPEGVETQEQLAFLRERGCNAMQGYLLARPLPAAEFAAFLRSRPQTNRLG